MFSISSIYWQDGQPWDLRPAILPHIPVALTSQDWLSDHDPVLEAVLRVIKEG